MERHRNEFIRKMSKLPDFIDVKFDKPIWERITICNLIILDLMVDYYHSDKDLAIYDAEIEHELYKITELISLNKPKMEDIYTYLIKIIYDMSDYALENELYETCANIKKFLELYDN